VNGYMLAAGLCLILASLGAAHLLGQLRAEHARRVRAERHDHCDTLPPSGGVLLTGRAAREALSATLRQLEEEPDAPVLCEMSGRFVIQVGLVTCPGSGCARWVDVDLDGRVEAHWTKPALPLPAERYAMGGPY
jgi:hypothetical protein